MKIEWWYKLGIMLIIMLYHLYLYKKLQKVTISQETGKRY